MLNNFYKHLFLEWQVEKLEKKYSEKLRCLKMSGIFTHTFVISVQFQVLNVLNSTTLKLPN